MSIRLTSNCNIPRSVKTLISRNRLRTHTTLLPVSGATSSGPVKRPPRADISEQLPTVNDIESPDRTKSRHLLRAILRECTYLPDSHARRYHQRYAIRRFRDYDRKAEQHNTDLELVNRLAAKQRDAQRALNRLRRAGEGELQALRALLLQAYGRTGRRRRELVTQLVHVEDESGAETPNGARDTTESKDGTVDGPAKQSLAPGAVPTTKIPSRNASAPKPNPYMPDISPPLRALMESQIKFPIAHSSRPNVRRMEPIIPELNTWLRPTPQVRVKNLTREWYASFLNKVNPPLPGPEWERLHDLATGRANEVLPQRRKATQPTKRSALDMQLKSSRIDSTRAFPNRQARTLTSRSMRRLWTQVFEQCPRLDWDAAQQEWKVTWGSHALHRLQYKPEVSLTTEPHNVATPG